MREHTPHQLRIFPLTRPSAETVSTSTLSAADARLCTLASSLAKQDTVHATFEIIDTVIETVLPEWQVASDKAKEELDPKAEVNNSPAPKPLSPVVRPAPVTVTQLALARLHLVHRRLLQRLDALLAYLWSTKIATSYAAIPTRAQASQRLADSIADVIATARQLRASLQDKQRHTLDHLTKQLAQLQAAIGGGNVSLSILRKLSVAVLNAHEQLLAARAALTESDAVQRIAPPNGAIRRTLDNNTWVARAHALAVSADAAFVKALQEACEDDELQRSLHQHEPDEVTGTLESDDEHVDAAPASSSSSATTEHASIMGDLSMMEEH